MSTTEVCTFKHHQISFTLAKDNSVMVNATEMAKAFGKQVKDFTRNEDTKRFIEVCLKKANSPFINIKCEEDLISSTQKSGTFMHRVLALKFAAWLNPEFELWVFATIERLLFGRHVEREQSFERTLSLQHTLEELQSKPSKSGEDFELYLATQKELRREVSLRKALTSESLSGMKSLFEKPS